MSGVDDKARRALVVAAKNRVGKWQDAQGDPTADRRALLSAVDILLTDIATRDDQIECRTVLLGDPAAPKFSATTAQLQILPCRRGLAVRSYRAPGWSDHPRRSALAGRRPHRTQSEAAPQCRWAAQSSHS
jgi:hypothetical protein